MEVSKKENGAYVKQGEVVVYYPLLSELGLNAETDKTDDDGFPIYSDDKVQYVFDAVLAAVKAQARNKLVSGSAELKPGLSIASTVEELLESGSGNKGEALAAVREMLAAFKAFLPTTGKSEKYQLAAYNAARQRDSITVMTDDKKQKMQALINAFAESLTAEQAARFSRPLLAINEACESGDPFDEE
jgi:hypothetical protein